MNKIQKDVQEFHTKFGFNTDPITWDRLEQRALCHREEAQEFTDAVEAKDIIGMIDAALDGIYFAVGSLDLLGIDFEQYWNHVHKANMRKERGTKPERPNSGGFDTIKPEGWVGPEAEHKKSLKFHQQLNPAVGLVLESSGRRSGRTYRQLRRLIPGDIFVVRRQEMVKAIEDALYRIHGPEKAGLIKVVSVSNGRFKGVDPDRVHPDHTVYEDADALMMYRRNGGL